jgi:hypothetical protein
MFHTVAQSPPIGANILERIQHLMDSPIANSVDFHGHTTLHSTLDDSAELLRFKCECSRILRLAFVRGKECRRARAQSAIGKELQPTKAQHLGPESRTQPYSQGTLQRIRLNVLHYPYF